MNTDFIISRRRRSFDESEPRSLRHYSWAAVAGAAVTIGGQLLAPKAKAPQQAAPIDLGQQQTKAIASNTANEGDIESLISRANSFSQDQNLALMEKAMPGYTALAKRFTGQANDLLTDPYSLPKDVQDNIARLAAERGISAGTKGEFNDFSLLRDFGINSLQYGQSRIGQAQSITQMLANLAPKVNPLSPMSFYVTPAQTAQVAAGQQSANQAGLNAQAAAGNYNNASTWAAISNGLGRVVSGLGSDQNTGNQAGTGGDYMPPLGGNAASAAYVRSN